MNYYRATFTVVTASRAKLRGLSPSRHYGYYVLSHACENNEYGIECWCKTKRIAQNALVDRVNWQKKGFYSCPCGSGRQARGCCGIPTYG